MVCFRRQHLRFKESGKLTNQMVGRWKYLPFFDFKTRSEWAHTMSFRA